MGVMVSSPPGSSGPRAAHFLASRSFLLALVLICSTVGGGLAGAIVARAVGPGSDVDPAAAGVGFGATDLPGMIARIAPGVVAIEVMSTGIDAGGRSTSEQVAGSGFVMDADGMIATNAHVVDGATSITVVFSDGAHVAGRIVGVDRTADLAVVRVSRRALEPLVMDQGGPVRVGEPVVAVGNALALEGSATVTLGIVSATGRSVQFDDGQSLTGMVQTDAAISSGDSGGPLLSSAGEVVAINTGGVSATDGELAQNIGFAIPISRARPVLERLARAG